MTPLRVGITYHERFGQYDLGADHPFRGDRFTNVMRVFEEQGLLGLPNVVVLKPRLVSKGDLLRVHDADYVDLVFRLAELSKPYDIETPVSPGILEAARLVIGGAIEAGKAVYDGVIDRAVALGCGYHQEPATYIIQIRTCCLFRCIRIRGPFILAQGLLNRLEKVRERDTTLMCLCLREQEMKLIFKR